MTDAPVIIKRSIKTKEITDFPFSANDIPVSDNEKINEIRQKAWEVYQSTSFPTLAEEAWRRTDLSRLDKPSYRIPDDPRPCQR